jgi:hypothetical protein
MVHRFPTPIPPRLTVEFRSGSVTVRTEDTDETTVDLHGKRDDDATRRLIAETTIAQRGDEVVVLVPKRKGLLGRSPDLVLAVTAPKLTTLAIESGSADVSVLGEVASSSITTGSGDIAVGHVAGSLRMSSGSGDVRAERIDGDAEVTTGSGDIGLEVVGGSASASSGSGNVRIGTGGVSLEVKTGSGDVEVGTAPHRISAKTGSGHVQIDSVRGGDVTARTASGDIRAGVLDGIAAWLDVRTVTGRVSSELAAAPEPGGDDDRVRLQLETVTGDIELTRVQDS